MDDSTRLGNRGKPVVSVSRVLIALMALASVGGCRWLGDPPIEDLGSTAEGSVDGEPDPERRPGQLDPGFAGRWQGYAEDPFQLGEDGRPLPAVFPSGSTTVTLDYRFADLGRPEATLVFGAGPAPMAVSGAAYPPGFHHYYSAFFDASFKAPVVEGFEYVLSERSVRVDDPDDASLLATLQLAAYEAWCAAQPPLAAGPDEFNCVGAAGVGGGDPLLEADCVVQLADGTEKPTDCDLAAMCTTDLCACDANGCTLDRFDPMQVYLQRDGDDLTATVSGASIETDQLGWYAPLGTLRLHRVAE